MTVDTVINYFLKAGASLRRSELWRGEFEDVDGKSRVMRSGRFGVGVLAAYLLGEEISVSTRHVTAPEGVEFSTKLDAEYIELKRIKRPVGTTIRVKISDEIKDALYGVLYDFGEIEVRKEEGWDWYCLTSPTVVRKFCGTQLKQQYALPSLDEKLPLHWHKIIHPDYADIHWTFSMASELICNGIRIRDYHRSSLFRRHYEIKCPAISIFDFNAKLPLNLQRNTLAESKFPFEEELIDDILKDILAYILVNAPTFLINNPGFFSQFAKHIVQEHRILPSKMRLLPFLSLWFTAESGFSFALDSWHIQELHSKNILLLTSFPEGSHDSNILPDNVTNISHPIFHSLLAVSSDTRKPEKVEVINETISFNIKGEKSYNKDYDYVLGHQILRNLTIPEKRILISRHMLQQLEDLREHQEHLTFEPLADDFMSLVREEWSNEDWVLWQVGECPPPVFDFEKFAEENPGDQTDIWPGILAEWYMKKEQPEFELSPLARVWRDVLGEPIIPFKQKRRKVLTKVRKEFKPYIDAHEIMKKEGYEKFGLKELVDDE